MTVMQKYGLIATVSVLLGSLTTTIPDHAVNVIFGPGSGYSLWNVGNFAPVRKEFKPTLLTVSQGSIPTDLSGAFLRIGPNPEFEPDPKFQAYHWFDGEGMVHSVGLREGDAFYSNAYVRTPGGSERHSSLKRYVLGELNAGWGGALRLLISHLREFISFAKSASSPRSASPNTNTFFWNNKVYALVEAALPFEIDVSTNGSVYSKDFDNFNGKVDFATIAHIKADRRTNEVMLIGYIPHLQYTVLTVADGTPNTVHADPPLTIALPSQKFGQVMAHDFMITQHYSIIVDHSLRIFPRNSGFIQSDPSVSIRFGLLERHANRPEAAEGGRDPVRWTTAVSPGVIFHVANAWEEGNTIVLYAVVHSPRFNFSSFINDECTGTLTKFVIDLTSDALSVTETVVLEGRGLEFPRVNDMLVGYPTRFLYAVSCTEPGLRFSSIVKFDVQLQVVAGQVDFKRQYLSEAVFVSLNQSSTTASGAEDDGYLLTFAFDERTNQSFLVALNASTFNTTPVFTALLPQRVPFGFHANFLPRSYLTSAV